MKGNFKVGDRVIVNGKYDGLTIRHQRGEIVCDNLRMKSELLIEFDKPFSICLHDGDGKGKEDRCWWINPYSREVEIKRDREHETIVIYRDGNEVIACNTFTDKKAVARCNPEDTFDFETGARLAFERLFEKPKYNARVVCVRANTLCFTKGKIYEVKDGIIFDDNKDGNNRTPFKNFEELSETMISSFVEIKED